MKFIDLYAGIGGFRYALESFGHKCVFSAEINKYSIETYQENFGDDSKFDMDEISKMNDEEIDKLIPSHEILVGGFPCQSFSIAGKKKGFETSDTRGTQFFNILRILEVKKPRYIILENVKHLVKHDNGKTYNVIVEELKNVGYNLSSKPIILSPTDIGIPQNRERTFIVGDIKEEVKEFKVPKEIKIEQIKLDKVTNTNLSDKEEFCLKAWEEFILNVKRTETGTIPVIWVDEMLDDKVDPEWQPWKLNYVNKMRSFYEANKKFIDGWISKYDVTNWNNRKYRKLEWSSGNDDSNLRDGKHIIIRPSGFRVRNTKHFPTLVASVETPIIFDKEIDNFRFLTTREVARLQSFPEKMVINKNPKEAYKQFGNAVNVEVIKTIVKEYIK